MGSSPVGDVAKSNSMMVVLRVGLVLIDGGL